MKFKRIVPLIVVFVILLGIVLMRAMQEEAVDLREAARIVALAPDDVSPAEVHQITLYAGHAPDEAVVLARADDGEWVAESRYGAPADAAEIEMLLGVLADLSGEYRAAVPDDAAREPFGLTEEEAFHVVAAGADGESLFHIKSGRAPSPHTVFVSRAGDDSVYVSDVDLRAEAGVSDMDPGAGPDHSHWLDLDVLALDTERVKQVTLTMPDKRLVLARKSEDEPAAENDEGNPGNPAEGVDPGAVPLDLDAGDALDGQPAAVEAEPAGAEFTWVVEEAGLDAPFRESGMDTILRGLGGLRAVDVADPGADWGFGESGFVCEVILEDEDEPLRIEGVRPEPAVGGYVRRAGSDVVYEVSGTQFERLFPQGAELFELPAFAYDSDALESITIEQPEGRVVLARVDGEWTVESPVSDLNVARSTVQETARALARLRPIDYADSAEGAGLDEPERRIAFETGDGDAHRVEVGGPARSVDGSYSYIDDNETVMALSRTDIQRLFVRPDNFYERTLTELSAGDVASLAIERDEDSFELQRREDTWMLYTDGTQRDAADRPANSLAQSLVSLQASRILFDEASFDAEVLATVRFATLEDDEYTLTIGAAGGEGHPAQLSGIGQVVLLEPRDVNALLPASTELLDDNGPEQRAEDEAAPAPPEEGPVVEFVEPEEQVITPEEL